MSLTTESQPWPEVVGFYRELSEEHGWDCGPMLELVEFLAGSPYAAGLFPTTSIARLCLGRTRNLRWYHEMLTVEYDPSARRFHFTYFEASPRPAPWVSGCDASFGRAHLERLLIKRLRWFQEEGGDHRWMKS